MTMVVYASLVVSNQCTFRACEIEMPMVEKVISENLASHEMHSYKLSFEPFCRFIIDYSFLPCDFKNIFRARILFSSTIHPHTYHQ